MLELLLGILVAIFALSIDQLSKYFVISYLHSGEVFSFGNYFNVVQVWNTGVSFSMFSNHGQIGVVLLSLVSVAVCCFLIYWMYHETNKIKIMALGLIIGGAIGNVVDRLRFGAVTDFLDFHYREYHWPAFNVADMCICIGAMILIIVETFQTKKRRNK